MTGDSPFSFSGAALKGESAAYRTVLWLGTVTTGLGSD
jgi:hypothetical protein